MDCQRISMVTLAVSDLEVSRKFYAAIGWQESEGGNDKIAFFAGLGQYFALYSKDALVQDIAMPIHGRSTGNVTLATNYASKTQVDSAFQTAMDAGAIAITKPTEVFWGGYSGYFADPDGHLWEVAYNPFWDFDSQGAIKFN